jgi:hypothetical protein
MDRKIFLKSCGMVGVGSCFMAGTVESVAKSLNDNPHATSLEKKNEFALTWVKRFFDTFDKNLDDEKKKEIMEANGKLCFESSLSGNKITPIDIDDLIARINQNTGEIAAKREDNVVYFHYVGNPSGLKVADGYCLCPLVESGPAGLSGTYCHCSVGYVKHMFETYSGRKASVELLESLHRGGKSCRFKITFIS